jgi:hypothetical protein
VSIQKRLELVGIGNWELGSRIIIVHKNFILGAIGNRESGMSIKKSSSLKIFGHQKNNQVLAPNSICLQSPQHLLLLCQIQMITQSR